MADRRFVKKTDVLIIISALALGAAAYMLANSGAKSSRAEVLHNNTVIKVIDLDHDGTYAANGFENVTFEVKNGAVRFSHSDCPDKICVKTGFIKNKGQSAVCLPNRLTLRITGDSDNKYDAYTG